MTLTRVVPTFDPFKNRHLRFDLTFEATPVQQLALERCEEALRHRRQTLLDVGNSKFSIARLNRVFVRPADRGDPFVEGASQRAIGILVAGTAGEACEEAFGGNDKANLAISFLCRKGNTK